MSSIPSALRRFCLEMRTLRWISSTTRSKGSNSPGRGPNEDHSDVRAGCGRSEFDKERPRGSCDIGPRQNESGFKRMIRPRKAVTPELVGLKTAQFLPNCAQMG